MGVCPHCSARVAFMEAFPPGRADRCEKCGFDLRCCKACRHYDPSSYNECRESAAERVVEKTKANFCDWFKFGPSHAANSAAKDELLEKAKALFKK